MKQLKHGAKHAGPLDNDVQHHKPTVKNWIRHTRHAKFSMVAVALVFGFVGYTLLRGSLAATVTVTLRANGQLNQATIFAGDPLALSWTSANATSCVSSGSGGNSVRPTSGSQSNPSDTTYSGTRIYTLTCNNGSDSAKSSVSVTVTNRAPGVTLFANNQSGSINLTKGAPLNLSWTVTNYPNSCSASGNWQGQKNRLGGSENRSGDTAGAGTKTYTIVCNNTAGSATSTVTVNVAEPPSNGGGTPPPPPPPGGGGGGGTPPGGGGGGGNPAPQPSNPPIQGPGTSPATLQPDTTPPSSPSGLTAVPDEESGVVRLSWVASTDNIAISRYQVERSTDQQAWESLTDSIVDTHFSDAGTRYQTEYFYRVRAFDTSNNASEYATVSVTTSGFKANVTSEGGGIVRSDDELISVVFPAGSINEDAQCAIVSNNEFPELPDDYLLVYGPFYLVCKNAAGDIIADFNEPLQVHIHLDDTMRKSFNDFRLFTQSGDQTSLEEVTAEGSLVSGQINGTDVFSLVGKRKTTPLIFKILLILFVLVLLAGGVLGLLYWRYKRKQQAQYENYMHQQYGI